MLIQKPAARKLLQKLAYISRQIRIESPDTQHGRVYEIEKGFFIGRTEHLFQRGPDRPVHIRHAVIGKHDHSRICEALPEQPNAFIDMRVQRGDFRAVFCGPDTVEMS